MEQFEKLFVHCPEYGVIICKRCQFAVIPTQVEGHIKGKHGATITRSQGRAIADIARGLPSVAQTPREVKYPAPNSQPVEWIPVSTNGRRCIAAKNGVICNYVCCHRTGIQQHCVKKHNWKNPRDPGRQPRDATSAQLWEDNQICQRFFKTGGWQQYFAVAVQPPTVVTDPSNTTASDKREGKAYLKDLLEWIEEGKKTDNTHDRQRHEANPWLEHTMWDRHIGIYKTWAVRMIQPSIEEETSTKEKTIPNPAIQEETPSDPTEPIRQADPQIDEETRRSERALRVACEATCQLIRRSFKASRVENVGRAAMEYINRREAGAVNSDRPFYGKQKVNTIRRYAEKFVKILRYIWRTEKVTNRPEYRLTRQQQEALRNYRRTAARVVAAIDVHEPPRVGQKVQNQPRQDGHREQLVEVALTFWIAMFDHELGDNEYESAILSGLAVLGADTAHDGWSSAINYTPTLAAIITTVRAIVIRRAWRQRHIYMDIHTKAGMPEDRAREEAPTVFDGVRDAVHKFMTLTTFGSQPTPLNTIYTQKTYGMKIRYTTKSEGRISWEGSDTVLCRKIKFSMNDIRTTVHGLLSTVRQRLVGELLLLPVVERVKSAEWRPDGLPRFQLQQVADNHSILDEGWSFLVDIRNEWAVDGKIWMGNRLVDDPDVKSRFTHVDEGIAIESPAIQWNDDAVVEYLQAITRFKEELIVLVHMSAGAPARSTELTSIQRENGKDARSQRGVFIDNGLVAFVTTYHKGFSASQSMKNVHRFVPREVSEIVVYYLWLIEPFERIIQAGANRQQLFSPWLWEPAPEEDWPDPDEDDLDEGYESDAEPVTTPDQVDNEGDEGDDGVVEDQTEREPRNCDGFWTTDRVRRVMRRETQKRIRVAIGISDWRQVYPAIHREVAADKEIRSAIDQIYDTREKVEPVANDPMAVIRAKQSGHSFETEEDIYGRSLQQSPFTTIAEKEMFRRVSRDWHRFLQFPSAWEEESIDPNIRRRIKQEQDDAKFRRFEQMRAIKPLVELRRFYQNPTAQFRGLQAKALDTITQGHPRVVVVMRTGGGKSLLFMLPAAASNGGVTIVVVPKKALQANMKQRCIDGGIKCAVWSEGRPPPYDAKIIFVIAESAVSQTFADFINSKVGTQQLERVVIDECHTIMQSTDEWRPHVRKLRELAGRSTQVVCLTATLPPAKQAEFMSAMDIDEKEGCILRESTTRANIAYSIREYNSEEGDAAIHALVEEKKAQYPREDKIVIYCQSIKRVKHLAETFGYTAFFRNVGTEEEKADIVAQLNRSEERVFVTTNALGEGIDAPSIRVVIHDGINPSLDNYGQESGRAGRDGHTPSEAIISRKVYTKAGKRRPDPGWKTEPAMQDFIRGDVCRRVVMDRYMDGVPTDEPERTTCQRGEQFCDVCCGRGAKRVRVVLDDGSQQVVKRVCTGLELQQAEEQRFAAMQKFEEEQQQARTQQYEQEEQARFQYERQQRQYEAIEQRQCEERIEAGEIQHKMELLFKEWKHNCSICRVRGRDGWGHNWRTCEDGKAEQEDITLAKDRMYKVKWENGRMCCRQCWLPQAICHSYEAIDHTGRMRYRKKDGASCQFRGVLCEAASVIVAIGRGEILDWLWNEAVQAGVDDRAKGEIWEAGIHQWLGSSVTRGGLEMSGMCWMFYTWASLPPT